MSTINTDDMRQVAYDFYANLLPVGATTNGSTNVVIGQNRVAVENAEQVKGVIKLWRSGMTARIETTLKEVAPSKLSSIIALGISVRTSGSKSAYGIGTNRVNIDPYAFELRLQPTGQDLSDTTDSWIFWRAASVQEFTYSGNIDEPQEVGVVLEALPDLTRGTGFELGAHNHHEISQGTPRGVWIATGNRAKVPGKHLTAMTLTVDEIQQLQCYEHQSDISTTVTALMNEATLTATQKTINIDALSLDNGIAAGNYVILDSGSGAEIVYVESVVRLSATTAELTVVRGVHGTTAAAHADNISVELLEGVQVWNRTYEATWASSGSNVDAGNTFTSNSQNKGEVTGVSSGGPDNITATFATKASPNTAITVA